MNGKTEFICYYRHLQLNNLCDVTEHWLPHEREQHSI